MAFNAFGVVFIPGINQRLVSMCMFLLRPLFPGILVASFAAIRTDILKPIWQGSPDDLTKHILYLNYFPVVLIDLIQLCGLPKLFIDRDFGITNTGL